jgi:membrane protein required for colicin V production
MPDITPIDTAILTILLIGMVRGIVIGMIREVFSIAALGGACIAVRHGLEPASIWLMNAFDGQIGPTTASWTSGAAIAIAVITLVVIAGRILKRGASAAGLGWLDRAGGAVLGSAEGALVVSILLLAATWAMGRDHPALAASQGVEAFTELQSYVMERSDDLPDVAAPPR